jgi:hypothetical protein
VICPALLHSQGVSALRSVNYLRSVSSLGMGEQGVASRSALDAMPFSPANLVYSNAMEFSYFQNPFFTAFDNGLPFTSIASTISLPGIGYFGIEYTNWDEGVMAISTPSNPEPSEYLPTYERSVAVGYARNLNDNFSGGVSARFVKGSFGEVSTSKLFISAGLNYDSRILDRNFNAGFSLMNFGTPVEYIDYAGADAPPSTMNLGANYFPVEEDHASIAIQLEATKPIEKQDDSGVGQSSLTSLFNDWSDFPNDVIAHAGMAFRWKQLDLGNGFSFGQEFYIGNTSAGAEAGLRNYLTHGATVILGYNDYRFSVGYGSPWYNMRNYSYSYPTNIPSEMFQITLSTGHSPFAQTESHKFAPAGLKRIIILAGTGPSLRVGRYHETYEPVPSMHMDNTFSYFLESDFYIDNRNALVAKLTYNNIPLHVYMPIGGTVYTLESQFETIAISSLYRYHPLADLLPLYVQGGLGIIRTNPVVNVSPHYYYNSTFAVGTGACFELVSNVYVVPSVDFIVMLSRVSYETPGMGGYNQFDLGLKLGYAFE